jgi:hypothetical protein
MSDRIDRIVLATLAGVTCIYLVLFAYYLDATAIRVPVYDLLAWIMHYARFWNAGDWWAYLWLPHNEHRILWSRLLLLIDIEWFRGNTVPFAVFAIGCLIVLVGGIGREILASSLPAPLRSMLALLAVLLLTTSYIVIDCSIPSFGVFIHTAGFFVLSLLLLDGAGEEGKFPTVRRLGAVASASFSAFGVSGGLLAPVVLLWAAWRGGLGARWLIGIGAVAALLIAVYVPGLPFQGGPGMLDPMRVLHRLDYAVRFLGLPWSHMQSLVWFGRLVGAIVLGASIVIVLRRGFLGMPRERLERISVGLLLFTILMAVLVSVGRADIAADREMPIRYGIFAALAQVGLLLALSSWLARVWEGGGRRPLQWGALGAALLLIVQQVAVGEAGRAVAAQYVEAYRSFAAGRWTPEMNKFVFPDRAAAEQGLAIARAEGIYQN